MITTNTLETWKLVEQDLEGVKMFKRFTTGFVCIFKYGNKKFHNSIKELLNVTKEKKNCKKREKRKFRPSFEPQCKKSLRFRLDHSILQ
jgi:hypothetical protein